MNDPKGYAHYDGKFLTIKVPRAGKKKLHVQTYLVEDCRPDPKVANPAYSLTKGKWVKMVGGEPRFVEEKSDGGTFFTFGEVYHVSVQRYGPVCDCPAFERWNQCKHARSMAVVGLLTKKE